MKKALVLISVFLTTQVFPQIGGTKTYRFLELPMTARAAGLGGNSMAIWGDDINLIYSNPALLNPSMVKQAAFNYCNFVGDMNLAYLAYAHDLKKYGTAAISVQSFGYGSFEGYDELEQATGKFKAADYSINMAIAKPLADSMFNVGLLLKTIFSQYEVYQSIGNAIDFGITYHNKKDFTASLVAKNIGMMWKSYSPSLGREPLPHTVQIGLSKKVDRAPFRLFVVYDQLLKWNLKYISPVDTTGKTSLLNSGTTAIDSSGFQKFAARGGSFGDNVFRHLTLGTEILITKNFNLRIAYNYRRQKEMILPERRGINGFSFGIGFRVKRFGFSYAFTKMAFPGNSSMLGLTFSW